MNTLFLDTHANKVVVVIFKDNKIIVKKEVETIYNHSETTMPILIEALNEANCNINDINLIICVNGPGSFTGVRIGVTIAKTLAFTLKVPIKVISSLLIKAVSFDHDNINILESEKNGVFLANFDKNNNLIGEYKYYSNNDFKESKINALGDIKIDYLRILDFVKTIEDINPHLVNPLYVKKIEVLK